MFRYTKLTLLREVGLWALALIFLAPFYFLVTTALKPDSELFTTSALAPPTEPRLQQLCRRPHGHRQLQRGDGPGQQRHHHRGQHRGADRTRFHHRLRHLPQHPTLEQGRVLPLPDRHHPPRPARRRPALHGCTGPWASPDPRGA